MYLLSFIALPVVVLVVWLCFLVLQLRWLSRYYKRAWEFAIKRNEMCDVRIAELEDECHVKSRHIAVLKMNEHNKSGIEFEDCVGVP